MDILTRSNIDKYIRESLVEALSEWLYNTYLPAECDVSGDVELNELEASLYVAPSTSLKNKRTKLAEGYSKRLSKFDVNWQQFKPDSRRLAIHSFVESKIGKFDFTNIPAKHEDMSHLVHSIDFCLNLQDELQSLSELLKEVAHAKHKTTESKTSDQSHLRRLTERAKLEVGKRKVNYTTYIEPSYLLQSGHANFESLSSKDEDQIDYIIALPEKLLRRIINRIENSKGANDENCASELADLALATNQLSDMLRLLVKDFVNTDWVKMGFIASLQPRVLESVITTVTLLNKIGRLQSMNEPTSSTKVDGYTRLCWFAEPELLVRIFKYLFEECVTDAGVRVIRSNEHIMQALIVNNFCNETGESVIFQEDGVAVWSQNRPSYLESEPVKWNWQANSLAAVFYDLHSTYKYNGSRYPLERNDSAIASFVSRNFLNKNGRPFVADNIERPLNSNGEKLPKFGEGDNSKRISLSQFFPQGN